MPIKIDFKVIQSRLLVNLHDHYANDRRPTFLKMEEIFHLMKGESKNAVMDTVFQCIEKKYVLQLRNSENAQSDEFQISMLGISHAQKITDPEYLELLNGTSIGTKDVEINEWEPLKFEGKETELKQAIEQTENAIEKIQSSNGFAAKEHEKRNNIIESLKIGLNQLREKTISQYQLTANLIAPLKFILTKFTENIVGEAAKKALSAIINLFQ